MRVWRKIDKTLRSPTFTVALICIIGIGSILGTIPVGPFETASGGGVVAKIVRALGAGRLYRTWWYTLLLACLAFIMTYCSLRRLPSIIRAFTSLPDSSVWSRERSLVTHCLTVPEVSKDVLIGKARRVLSDRGYRIRAHNAETDNANILFEKGRAGILGPPLVHLGLVIAFIGGLITHSFGTQRDITIGEGEVYQIPGTESKIKLEKFSIILNQGKKEPEEYVSTLMVTEQNGVQSWRMLRVNQPVTLAGTTLYQMKYRPEVRRVSLAVFEPSNRDAIGTLTLMPGEKVELPGRNLSVELGEIVPDFAIDSDHNVFSQSQYFLNPAAKVSIYSADRNEPVWTGWAFKGMLPPHDSQTGPLLFSIDRVSLKYYSGIKMVKDPGTAIVYFGFVLLVCGSFVSSYLFRRFVRVEVADGANGSEVRVSGYSVKNQPDFVYELKGLPEHMRKVIEE